MVICDAKLTSGRGGLQLWKCLYLARNVTKGNNVLSQSTLMDLPIISPVPPLTRETTANKAALPLTARVLLTAVQHCWRPVPPASETHTLTSDLAILEIISPSDLFGQLHGCKVQH